MGQFSNDAVAKASAVVDFSITPSAATAETNIPGLIIPAGAYVVGVYLKVKRAEGGTLTVDVGDATDPNGFIAAADANAAAGTSYPSAGVYATDANAQGKAYTADTNLTITTTQAADNARVDVTVYARLPG